MICSARARRALVALPLLLASTSLVPLVGCGSGAPDGSVVQNAPDSNQKRQDKVKDIQKQMLEQNKSNPNRRR